MARHHQAGCTAPAPAPRAGPSGRAGGAAFPAAAGRRRPRGGSRGGRPRRPAWRETGPAGPRPSYDDGAFPDRVFLALFAAKVGAEVGRPPAREGFDAMMELVWELQRKGESPKAVQAATRRVLQSLFPAWLLPAFRALFARPFPAFSNVMVSTCGRCAGRGVGGLTK